VDCAGDSSASGVAVVMVSLFGHEGGEEGTSGIPGVGGASATVAPRSWLGGLA
jgi:hypothetical protein